MEIEMLRVLIDADGCPVVDETVEICKKYEVKCLILCDTSHYFNKAGAEVLTFSKGADSVDFALVNLLKDNDIVITQDYGLAAMALAKKAKVLNENGIEYTNDNIDSFLSARYTSKKLRNAGVRLKGSGKRKASQDEDYVHALKKMIEMKI